MGEVSSTAGMKLAVVSNFDTRLRAILRDLDLLRLFDSVVISAEVKVEKPNPAIFELACSQLGVSVAQALVLGDDRRCAYICIGLTNKQ